MHARRSRYGSLRVAHELREHGVADELIGKAVAEVEASELETARQVHGKKFAGAPQTREEWAKQARFFFVCCFGFDIIRQVLRDSPDQHD